MSRPIEKVRVKLEPTRFAHPVIDGRQCTLEKTCLSIEERRPRHRSMEQLRRLPYRDRVPGAIDSAEITSESISNVLCLSMCRLRLRIAG